MGLFDRYLIQLFAKTLLVCFASMAGLYIVIDSFNNLDEFLTFGEQQGGLVPVLMQYYGPRVLTFFDRISGLLALAAALFTLTWLQRTNEMTAILAAGVPKSRVMRPLILSSACISLLAVGNRELLVPQFRDPLTRNAQNLAGEAARRLDSRYDYQTNVLLSGRHTIAAEQRIDQPTFILPPSLHHFSPRLVAVAAFYRAATDERPAGYLLDQVQQPVNLVERPSAYLDGEPVVFSPSDTAWLQPQQCFLVSAVDFDQLAHGKAWRTYSSSHQLITAMQNPSLDYGADTKVTIHARFVQPLLDVTLLFLGLPLVASRQTRNVFLAAGMALLLVAVYFLVIIACQAMGSSYLLQPALAAWLPLIVFAPLAYHVSQRRWD